MKRTTSRLLLALSSVTLLTTSARADFKAKAEEATQFIQTNFYVPSARLYRPSYPRDLSQTPYDFMWGNGVMFSALVGGTRHNPTKYKPILDAFGEGLKRYWDSTAPIPGFDAYFSSPTGDDKYYDDNEWLVLGFVEAYEVTKDQKWLDWAEKTHAFVLSGWDTVLGGGIYWHQSHNSKNTCSNGPAAASALRLHQAGSSGNHVDWAMRIRTWTNSRLQDSDGLYWDNVNVNGSVDRTKFTYNTALMIRTNVLLYEILKDPMYLTEAKRVAAAAMRTWQNRTTGAMSNSAKFNHLLCESLLDMYRVTDDVRYLNAVRKNANFGYKFVRDPKGGYWNDWANKTHPADERKTLIENASVARLFWMLAPYPDTEEMVSQSIISLQEGDAVEAVTNLKNAYASDVSVNPRPAAEPQAAPKMLAF